MNEAASDALARDSAQRALYVEAALRDIPRLLGATDRNPYRPTYGCLDRQYWHYRTSSFPSLMYQEGVLPLALVYAHEMPGNRWHDDTRVRELAVAALRFSAAGCHRDGSCDDYYPFERALGAAVFSLQAGTAAYQILQLDDPEIVDWFERCGRWLIDHNESGRLANHQALAALALARVHQITGKDEYRRAAEGRLDLLLDWQSDEGWFDEYGGADPGYQTVSIDCLVKIRAATGDARLDEPLRRAVAFARAFLHLDGSYAGEYGSRGTYHFYPHGMELLAGESADAADLADGFLHALAEGQTASFDDDRMYAHRLGNLIEAYLDWSPTRPSPQAETSRPAVHCFRQAQLLVRRTIESQTVISAARGGVFKHFDQHGHVATDAGLILETTDGQVAVSQMHDLGRQVQWPDDGDAPSNRLVVSGPLHWCRFETVTPVKQSALHLGMVTVGRWCRTLVRRLLQRRLITGRRSCPVRLTRCFEFFSPEGGGINSRLRITDTLELTDAKTRIRRMSFGTDHQAAYVAASGVYQPSVLHPWIDLQPHVEPLNTQRRVTVIREFSPGPDPASA